MASLGGNTYVFTVDAVQRSVARLVAQPIHEHFAGYLAILRSMRISGENTVQPVEITEFHNRFLRVEGDEDAPFVSPFRSRGHGSLVRINRNVAGSYAPSSLRAGKPLGDLISVEGARHASTYSLKTGHAAAALNRLLRSQKVPAVATAVFILRDYGLDLDAREIPRALALFRYEFGLRPGLPEEASTYDMLFSDDLTEYGPEDLEIFRTAEP